MTRIVIFCAGNIAKQLLAYPLKSDCKIELVCDNNQDKWGSKIYEYTIEPPQRLVNVEYDIIIISSITYDVVNAVEQQLQNWNISKNKIITATAMFSVEYLHGDLDRFFNIERKPFIPFKRGHADIYMKYVGETSHCHDRREKEGFFEKYCKGEGLDIGYGADLVVPNCSGWDLRNGDAQFLHGVEDESFDFVYSSHCLEHMVDVRISLRNWFRVVKRGGFLIVAIPHRDLYEKKKRLPSRWNMDHKHMFLIGKEEYPDTLDIVKEVKESIANYDIKYVKTCDEGHTITDPLKHSNGEYQIEMVIKKL